ncbi:MAG: DUF5678 domain-containing protein [Caldilineaceae bacterium]
MLTVTLQPDIEEQVIHLANESQTNTDTVVDQALRAYMIHYRHEKIRSETLAFNQQQAALLNKYKGKYVAIHNGQVIDHDIDLRVLHVRVFARLGRIPVLLKQVTGGPERELVFRSPRFERDRA